MRISAFIRSRNAINFAYILYLRGRSGKPSLHPHAQENRKRKEGFQPSEEGRKTSQSNTHFSGQES